MPTTNQTQQKSDTMQTVERLRAIADELEALADQFPHITWWKAFHHPLWNAERTVVKKTGCFYKLMVDEENIGQATDVRVGRNTASARVELQNLSGGVPVLYIDGLELCKLSHTRDEIVEVVEMLPEHLRLPIYKRMARIRKEDRREKREKKRQLRRELLELE